MDMNTKLSLAQRFIRLPSHQRRVFLDQLGAKGIDFKRLPISQMRSEYQQLPLSYAQQRQWLVWQLDTQSAAYHISVALRLLGAIDTEALQKSFEALVARHEILRTTFQQQNEALYQQIDTHVDVQTARCSLSSQLTSAQRDAQLSRLVEEEMRKPFDLYSGPLLRVLLIQAAENEHVLVMTQHHIISDGWSMQVMVDELIELYEAYRQGRAANLPELPIQYADYAIWQRAWMEAGEKERQLAYWQQRLGGEQPILQLPLDRPRPAVPSHRGARLDIPLSVQTGEALKRVAQQEGVTPFMLLLASFQLLLHRYSGQDDIRVGVPIANRNRLETERLIGFFVNTQVLKAKIDGQMTFRALLQQVRQSVLDAQEHQDLPFEQLVEALKPERNLGQNPLFQVLYNHQSAARGSSTARQLNGLTVEEFGWDTHSAQFDLTLNTVEFEQEIWASLTYATDIFDEETVERLGRHWHQLLEAALVQPQLQVGEIPLYTSAECSEVLLDWNPLASQYPIEDCIHQRIESQARRSPQAIALVCGEQTLSYAELNSRANRLAHSLIERGIGPDVLVGIAAERSLEMVIGLLAILKAGGAYVPLDPAYPVERLAYMIEDSGVVLLLIQRPLLEQLSIPEGLETLLLEDAALSANDSDPQVSVSADNLAYVIYTSGSTGQPKGTLLPHRNVLRLFEATAADLPFDASDVWALFHSYAFDFSVWELFGALMHGGRLVVVSHEASRSPEQFHELLHRERVTVLNQTPSAFRQLMHVACSVPAEKALHDLRYVIFGGETLEVASLLPWFDRFGDRGTRLVNMYGITETTVHVTYRLLGLADLEQEGVSPIGLPIGDLRWYLLDAQLNPVVKGMTGELYIGGAGLARGYLSRPGLSATRFVPDPFDKHEGGRLYRTGDLARYRADGSIEYRGRIDHQVKIRGFRIELGEIEARLLELDGVREAVVLPQEGPAGPRLVGYIVPEDTALVVVGEAQTAWHQVLRDALKARLPDYMVPAHLLFLERLPLTTNGKLDRRNLPTVEASQLQRSYVEPSSELERQIADIWAQVLGVERVGLTDNFFELGGHSLLAIQVVTRVKQLGVEVSVKDFFTSPSLQAFSNQLESTQAQLSTFEDELAKSMEALKRLSPDELEKLIS